MYRGSSIVIDCSQGGFCGFTNIDAIPAQMMVTPSKNVNINEGVRRPRGGTSHLYAAALPATPQVMGIYKFRLRSGTEYVMAATKDGKLYKDDTTTINAALSTSNYFSFETGDDTLFVADGATQVQTWNGAAAATSAIANPAADWGGAFDYPFQILKHSNVNANRMFALNADGLYWSVNNTFTDFLNAGAGVVYGDTGDGFGFVGMIEFGERLFVFGKKKAWFLDDSDLDPANWKLLPVAWEAGVAHWRLLVKTKNELFAATEEGDIYAVSAVQQFGDYIQASIAVPAGLDVWIKDNISLANIDKAHAVFDSHHRMLKWFFVRSGYTSINVCLPYCIDRKPNEAWCAPHDNLSYASGYNASCSADIRESTGAYRVYTGDYVGELWKTEMVNLNDNNEAYMKGFNIPNIFGDSPRTTKHFNDGFVVMEPQGSYNLYGHHWVDGRSVGTTDTISLAGLGGVLDTFVLDVSLLGGNDIIDGRFSIKQRGKRVHSEFYNTVVNQGFSISKIMYDYKVTGPAQ
jgi:hypothetical protein